MKIKFDKLIGQVVRLASGGPVMVIEGVDRANQNVRVVWVDAKKAIRREFFPVNCLRVVGTRKQ